MAKKKTGRDVQQVSAAIPKPKADLIKLGDAYEAKLARWQSLGKELIEDRKPLLKLMKSQKQRSFLTSSGRRCAIDTKPGTEKITLSTPKKPKAKNPPRFRR